MIRISAYLMIDDGRLYRILRPDEYRPSEGDEWSEDSFTWLSRPLQRKDLDLSVQYWFRRWIPFSHMPWDEVGENCQSIESPDLFRFNIGPRGATLGTREQAIDWVRSLLTSDK